MWSKCVIVLRLVNLNGKVLINYGHELINGGILNCDNCKCVLL